MAGINIFSILISGHPLYLSLLNIFTNGYIADCDH